MTNLLTVAVPTFKRPIQLRRLLLKLVEVDNINIVVCDNHYICHEENARVCKELNCKGNIKYFLNHKNVGFDQNVMQLILNSDTKYVFFCGDDDLIEPMEFSKFMLFLDKTDYSCIRTNLVFLDEKQEKISSHSLDLFASSTEISKENYNLFFTDAYFSGICLKRDICLEVIKNISEIENNYSQLIYIYQAYLKGTCYYYNEKLVYYIGDGEQIIYIDQKIGDANRILSSQADSVRKNLNDWFNTLNYLDKKYSLSNVSYEQKKWSNRIIKPLIYKRIYSKTEFNSYLEWITINRLNQNKYFEIVKFMLILFGGKITLKLYNFLKLMKNRL